MDDGVISILELPHTSVIDLAALSVAEPAAIFVVRLPLLTVVDWLPSLIWMLWSFSIVHLHEPFLLPSPMCTF